MKQYERNRRQWMLTKIGAGVIALLVVAGVVAIIVNWAQDRELNRVPDGVQSFSYSGGQHDDAFNAWTESPPVGGIHNNTWQQCGFYDGQIDPGKGVHTLEHGAVWITYSPEIPDEQKDTLRDLADQSYVLASEYPDLQSPIVASAWNQQLQIEDANDQELRQFIRVFKNNPENTPEYGATCATGSTEVLS